MIDEANNIGSGRRIVGNVVIELAGAADDAALRQLLRPLKRLIDALAAELLGRQYDPRSGIVRFRKPQPLRPELGAIPPGRLADPHIAFFARRNPGHAQGDELLCFAEVAEHNYTPAGWRIVHAARDGSTARAHPSAGSPPHL